MDLSLFRAVLGNLLHINVQAGAPDEDYLAGFEEKYCCHRSLQPMFCAGSLGQMIEKLERGILYEFRDRLGVCALFFRLEEVPVIAGPFVLREFDQLSVRRVMHLAGLPGSFEESIRLYYSNFPLCGMTRAIDTVLACCRAFCPDAPMLTLARIDDYPETRILPTHNYDESPDYGSVYRRYEMENRFLQTIERGDAENVLTAYDRMAAAALRDRRYVSAVYQDINVSLSIIRALARKAAENGGAPIVEIDEITQRAVQKMQAVNSVQGKVKITRAMFVELAEAVRSARSMRGSFSPPVCRTVEAIRHNYSQNLSLSELADRAGLSPSYLSRRFSQEVGMSISRYVSVVRCEEAASMLAGSDASIQQISAYVGYLDNNYFVKVFKKLYGMTPSGYRAVKSGK